MIIKHEDGRVYRGDPVGTWPYNCEPGSAITRVPNYRFRQVKYLYGLYDSCILRELGWQRETYFRMIQVEQPSHIEDQLVQACLRVAERMPGTSRFRKTE